jgi:acyl carrier protein
MEDKLREIMADILNVAPDEISSDTSTDSVASWDSLAQINLASAIEEEFGISFSVQEIEAMKSYDDIMSTLSGKL